MTITDHEPRPLSCPEMVELLTAYLDGALSEVDHASFEVHLGLCSGCTTYLDQFRETVRTTGALREEDVPDEAMATLLATFRDWQTTHRSRP